MEPRPWVAGVTLHLVRTLFSLPPFPSSADLPTYCMSVWSVQQRHTLMDLWKAYLNPFYLCSALAADEGGILFIDNNGFLNLLVHWSKKQRRLREETEAEAFPSFCVTQLEPTIFSDLSPWNIQAVFVEVLLFSHVNVHELNNSAGINVPTCSLWGKKTVLRPENKFSVQRDSILYICETAVKGL